MAKKDNKMIWVIGIVIAVYIFNQGGVFTGIISGNEVMTRTGPTQTGTGTTFDIAYTVSDASGLWAASVLDSVSGGCTFPNGQNSIQIAMVSDLPNPLVYTITAPSSDAVCVFSGDYQFGEFPVQQLNPYQIDIVSCQPSCVRPADLCVEAANVNDGCGGNCAGSWTVTQLTEADANCDGAIIRSELGTAITMWVAGTMTRTNLGAAISNWAGG